MPPGGGGCTEQAYDKNNMIRVAFPSLWHASFCFAYLSVMCNGWQNVVGTHPYPCNASSLHATTRFIQSLGCCLCGCACAHCPVCDSSLRPHDWCHAVPGSSLAQLSCNEGQRGFGISKRGRWWVARGDAVASLLPGGAGGVPSPDTSVGSGPDQFRPSPVQCPC